MQNSNNRCGKRMARIPNVVSGPISIVRKKNNIIY